MIQEKWFRSDLVISTRNHQAKVNKWLKNKTVNKVISVTHMKTDVSYLSIYCIDVEEEQRN